MSSAVAIEFVPFDAVGARAQPSAEGEPSVLVAFAGDGLALAPKTREVPAAADAGEEAGQGVEDTEDIAAAWAERRAIRNGRKCTNF